MYIELHGEIINLDKVQTIVYDSKECILNFTYFIEGKPIYYAIDYTDYSEEKAENEIKWLKRSLTNNSSLVDMILIEEIKEVLINKDIKQKLKKIKEILKKYER